MANKINSDTSEKDTTQKKKIIKNLALCGGGFYGYAEVGVLREIEEHLEHFDIQNIRGTSVGSIVAGLYAVGYTADELTQILFDLDFDALIKDSYLPYLQVWGKFGMYGATKLEQEIEKLISQKTNIKNCGFNQIDKNLTIIATNMNYQKPVLFNKDTHPTFPISKAIRMSIGYPGIFTPVLHEGDLYGDGGESINYPIITFENLDETIGVTFASHNENRDGTLKARTKIETIYEYLAALGNTMSRIAYTSQIKEEHLARSIVVSIDQDISSMQFKLSLEQKKYIYDCGIKAAKDQLHKIIHHRVS